MFRSIKWRMAVPVIITIVAGMSIVGAYLINFVGGTQTANLQTTLEAEARLTAGASLPALTDPEAAEPLSDTILRLGEQTDARITVISTDGTVLGDSQEDPQLMEKLAGRPEVAAALRGEVGESTRFSTTTGQNLMYIAVPIAIEDEVIGVARVALPITALEEAASQANRAVAMAIGITTALAVLVTVLILRNTTQPIKDITTATRRIASG